MANTTAAAVPAVLSAEHVHLASVSEVAMAEASTVLLCFYILLAFGAHYNLVYRRDSHHKYIYFCVPLYIKRLGTRNKRIDLFFPALQLFLVLPIVQATCVWRKHQDQITTESTQLAWITILIIGCISAAISMLYESRRTYFAHSATVMHLVPAFFFLYEGAVRHDASADIAASCMLIICCVIQFVSPPKMLKDNSSLYRQQEQRDDVESTNGLFSHVNRHEPIFTIANGGNVEPLSSSRAPATRRRLANAILSGEESSEYEIVYDSDHNQFDAYPQNRRKHHYDPWAARDKVRQKFRRGKEKAKRALKRRDKEQSRISEHVHQVVNDFEDRQKEQGRDSETKSDRIEIVRNYAEERKYNGVLDSDSDSGSEFTSQSEKERATMASAARNIQADASITTDANTPTAATGLRRRGPPPPPPLHKPAEFDGPPRVPDENE